MVGVKEILPPPFAWIEIPAGKVFIEKFGTMEVPAFQIARYPITNAQYAQFVQAGGYREPKWWTAAGWQQRDINNWTTPRAWHDARFNGDDQPVVCVSWYEAVAFCQWLGEISGEPVLLPTEQQWQWAAQGDERRAYPWGSEWDNTRCNNRLAGRAESRQTTPVQQYEGKGDSPFGVVDMSGNAQEWCLTEYNSGSNSLDGLYHRVLRGGLFYYNDKNCFRTTYRNLCLPSDSMHYPGFRCTRAY